MQFQIDAKNILPQALSSHSYSVEQMMPQSWKTNWSVKGMSEIDAFNRSRKIITLGNLTLVTQKLNSSMKNAAWGSKQKSLKANSMLKITTDYLTKAIGMRRKLKVGQMIYLILLCRFGKSNHNLSLSR